MFIDLSVDALVDHLMRFVSPKDSSGQGQSPRNADDPRSKGQGMEPQTTAGFFNQASHLVVANSTMVERADVVNNIVSTGKPVLERLEPYTMPHAAMDSSARDPPPKCHPGTRLKFSGKLETWLDDPGREWNMMWLRGPAGTGKSAVAQSFAEHCSERGRLGAAFFFSRPNDRNKPETVIPTLAYQLAVHCRSYNSALTNQLAADPQLLKKTPRVQLKKLIIEPFLILQTREAECIREPFIIILDGLDECEGERAQFEFVGMINEAAQSKDLPLLWLICSRPEAHLQYTFLRVTCCGREELLLDDECRDDVDLYLRDELARIKEEYADIAPPSWPAEDEFCALSGSVSGLFIFASTGLKFIGDPISANPVDRLKKLLCFLKHVDDIGTNNPLVNLDLLYTQILTDVPEETYPTTWRILACFIHLQTVVPSILETLSAQGLCNFLCIDRSTFYGALRKLHSVVAIPAPEEASKTQLRFHHASFRDFLSDTHRSGRFSIEKQRALIDIAKSCLSWHEIDTTRFHTNDMWDFDLEHRHARLPNLKWVSPDNEKDISRVIARIAHRGYGALAHLYNEKANDLASHLRDMDFRYIGTSYFPELANFISLQDSSDSIMRTEPSNELDMRLLEYSRTVIGQGPVDPVIFPIDALSGFVGRRKIYFFVGHGKKTIIVWLIQSRQGARWFILNLDREPSLEQIEQCQEILRGFWQHETPN